MAAATKAAYEDLVKQAEINLSKELKKLMGRIERIVLPSRSYSTGFTRNQLSELSKRIEAGDFYQPLKEFSMDLVVKAMGKNSEYVVCKVDWDTLQASLNVALGEDTEDAVYIKEATGEILREKTTHTERVEKSIKQEKVRHLQVRNPWPSVAGKWRRDPFAPRIYEPLEDYVVTTSVSEKEAIELKSQLNTTLHGYVGQAYNYDDQGLTQEWMTSFRDGKTSGPSEDDVQRTQIVGLMEIMMMQVQDRVCNELQVLDSQPLVLGKDVIEKPVWGIDSNTRCMIELLLEEKLMKDQRPPLLVKEFIERALLTTINRQDVSQAHNLSNSLQAIIQDEGQPSRHHVFARCILDAIQEYGLDLFKIHPKGTGVICIRPEGIPAHVLLAEYLGELYPSYRWCERMDVIEQAQKKFELKPVLPDFYNILLERPRQDPDGYGLLYVDASMKANIGSSCSHSCAANCTSAVVARNGKLAIAMTTNRFIHYGEELTMDYYSITTSDVEWKASVCLCGMTSCRGTFLSFATQDELQQVLNSNCGPVTRFASLLRACSGLKVSNEDISALHRHGIKRSIIGENPPAWMIKYAADILRFVEYERKALPCALLRAKNGEPSDHTFSSADMDARCVMEQRIQSMVCCFSMVNRVLGSQAESIKEIKPLVTCASIEVIQYMWNMLRTIPELIEINITKSNEKGPEVKAIKAKKDEVLAMLHEIRGILSPEPTLLSMVRETCLKVRQVLLKNEGLALPKARLVQLADILVLWASITHFSRPEKYEMVSADPIVVPARELGTTIPRTRIFKTARVEENKKKLRNASSSSHGLTINELSEIEGSTAASPLKLNIVEEELSCKSSTTPGVIFPTSPSSSISNAKTEVPISDGCIMDTTSNTLDVIQDQVAAVMEDSDSAMDIDDENVCTTAVIAAEYKMEVVEGEEGTESATTEGRKEAILSPNEPVFTGFKTYPPLFCFWQLIGWFNAGTDQTTDLPDLFGCVQLPDPACCFGPADIPYNGKARDVLLKILRDEKQQIMFWPAALKSTFNLSDHSNRQGMYGSPMLDVTLGRVDSVAKTLVEFKKTKYTDAMPSPKRETNNKKKTDDKGSKKGAKKAAKNSDYDDEIKQLDDILAPEAPTSWVQCDACMKWRRVPWHVDVESLPEPWHCDQNTWDLEMANCTTAQDLYDPKLESTLCFNNAEELNTVEACQIGAWRDVYCNKNHVYYEAQIIKIRQESKGKPYPMALFHYKGWSSKFDEWVECDSDRIKKHNLFTDPMAINARQQEAWQGIKPVQAYVRTAFVVSKSVKRDAESAKLKAKQPKSKKRQVIQEQQQQDEEMVNGDDGWTTEEMMTTTTVPST